MVDVASNWGLPALHPGHAPSADLVARRAEAASRPLTDEAPPDISVYPTRMGGVPCVVCEPQRSGRTIMYLHGGGYRMGPPRLWLGFAGRLASRSRARVVLVDYRLSPEHPFPAALHDSAQVYEALLREQRAPMVLMGDSAGGGLATALGVAALRAGKRPPDGIVLMSPWVDLTVRAQTYISRASTDQIFSARSARDAADLYLQGRDAQDPLASPLFASFVGFPRCLLVVGGQEVLLDDALDLAGRLARAGASVEAVVEASMQHVFVTRHSELPESRRAFDTIARFVCAKT
jgi:epsilon-lactone hydrolase